MIEDAMMFIGIAAIVAGVYLSFGLGAALIAFGSLSIISALLIAYRNTSERGNPNQHP